MNHVRERRVELGMSREALAVAADLSYEMVRRIETGKSSTSVHTAHRIAAALGTTLAALFPPPETPVTAGEASADLVARGDAA